MQREPKKQMLETGIGTNEPSDVKTMSVLEKTYQMGKMCNKK